VSDPERVWDLVRRDITEGLGAFFGVEEISFVDPTTRAKGPLTGSDGTAAVVWRCRCVDNKSTDDLAASFRSFDVEGVTMVQEVGGRWEFRRLIDWNGAIGAIGESQHRRSVRREGTASFFESQHQQ
jgi:hypothetical protein